MFTDRKASCRACPGGKSRLCAGLSYKKVRLASASGGSLRLGAKGLDRLRDLVLSHPSNVGAASCSNATKVQLQLRC